MTQPRKLADNKPVNSLPLRIIRFYIQQRNAHLARKGKRP